MAVQKGIDGDVFISASPSINVTNESVTDSGDHINYDTSVHKYWDKTQPFVLQESPNGTTGWVNVPLAEIVSFGYVEGNIQFSPARVPGTNNFIRVQTGNYFNVSELGDCGEWTLSLDGSVENTTPFQAPGGFEVNTATVKKASAKLSTFRFDNLLASQLDTMMVLVLYTSKTNNTRWSMYGWLTAVNPKAVAKGIITQEASFTVDADSTFYLL